MKKDTAYNVSKGLEALKKRAERGEVTLKVAGDVLLAEAQGPRSEDSLFQAKMDRLGWTWVDGKGWTHELDGKARGKVPAAKQAAPKSPANDRGGGDGDK